MHSLVISDRELCPLDITTLIKVSSQKAVTVAAPRLIPGSGFSYPLSWFSLLDKDSKHGANGYSEAKSRISTRIYHKGQL